MTQFAFFFPLKHGQGRKGNGDHKGGVQTQATKGHYPRQEAGDVSSFWFFKYQEDSQLSSVVTVTSQLFPGPRNYRSKEQLSLETDVFQELLGDAWRL